jgi:hypothetical protein
MKVEDSSIMSGLGDNWQTVMQIRSHLGVGRGGVRRCSNAELASALRRLAGAGQIERTQQETQAPRRHGSKQVGKFSIQYYRRRPGIEK